MFEKVRIAGTSKKNRKGGSSLKEKRILSWNLPHKKIKKDSAYGIPG